jgi:hypothetical protein
MVRYRGFENAYETSAGDRPKRMDVIPAGRERRSWTAKARARIIAQNMAPSANVAEHAQRRHAAATALRLAAGRMARVDDAQTQMMAH